MTMVSAFLKSQNLQVGLALHKFQPRKSEVKKVNLKWGRLEISSDLHPTVLDINIPFGYSIHTSTYSESVNSFSTTVPRSSNCSILRFSKSLLEFQTS